MKRIILDNKEDTISIKDMIEQPENKVIIAVLNDEIIGSIFYNYKKQEYMTIVSNDIIPTSTFKKIVEYFSNKVDFYLVDNPVTC
jgi:hypothetical protein